MMNLAMSMKSTPERPTAFFAGKARKEVWEFGESLIDLDAPLMEEYRYVAYDFPVRAAQMVEWQHMVKMIFTFNKQTYENGMIQLDTSVLKWLYSRTSKESGFKSISLSKRRYLQCSENR